MSIVLATQLEQPPARRRRLPEGAARHPDLG